MPNAYTENKLVQESASKLLQDELGWEVVFAHHQEKLGENGTLGRKDLRDVILTRYFRRALRQLNPWITAEQLDEAEQTMLERLSSASPLQINEEKYKLIRDGISVRVKKPDGSSVVERAWVIDFKSPKNNHFLAVRELTIKGEYYERRPDIVGFVNGLPLIFVELKAIDVSIQDAYTQNYQDYLSTIPRLFDYNAFLVLSNGMEAKIGTLGSKYEFFHEWKRLREKDEGSVALETMLRGVFQKETLLDLFENFIVFDHSGGKTAKILARNHQYLGVNEAVAAYQQRKLKNGKLGVFWHTQGSGKSYSMLFLAQKIRRQCEGSPTFVILTDRDELNKQISDTFENCGMLGSVKASQFIAQSGDDLIHKLKGNPGFIFTLIQKFNKTGQKPITPDHDIIIMSDEAHRSQYGVFAENMTALLPTASRIGFTGTPLFSSDAITERTFGGYVSIYDFKRAVDDGATVPLYYENRGERIETIRDQAIGQKIIDAIEAADLDVNQQEKLEREFAKEIHILTAEPRLRAIARDFVEHYSEVWTSGKAMFVCLNKVTCVRMYNFVQEYWQEKIDNTQKEINRSSSLQEKQDLERKLTWLRETEMAVVVSQEQNEIQTFQKWGLDILQHRAKMEKRELDKDFKDPNHPFRIVFVCAMWLTGFDVKSLSCLYLDKPLHAHTLMQTIARANRVNAGKSNGLIVDYIGIVRALREALAAYTVDDNGGKTGTDPTIDKDQLIARVAELIELAHTFLQKRGFSLDALVEAKDFQKMEALRAGAEVATATMKEKKEFQTYTSELRKVMQYLQRDDLSEKQKQYRDAIMAIDKLLHQKRRHADNTALMVEINQIISENLVLAPNSADEQDRRFDISQINFDILRREFTKSPTKGLLLKDLLSLVDERIQRMLKTNPTNLDYYDRYQKIIEDYNLAKDQVEIENIFAELFDLVNSMSREEQRYIREGFSSEEELTVFTLLCKDKDDLTREDIKNIKNLASELLTKIKALIAQMDHWTEKSETRAEVDNLIRVTLWNNLPMSYDDKSIDNIYFKNIQSYIYSQYSVAA